jgi:hypothetical protein
MVMRCAIDEEASSEKRKMPLQVIEQLDIYTPCFRFTRQSFLSTTSSAREWREGKKKGG